MAIRLGVFLLLLVGAFPDHQAVAQRLRLSALAMPLTGDPDSLEIIRLLNQGRELFAYRALRAVPKSTLENFNRAQTLAHVHRYDLLEQEAQSMIGITHLLNGNQVAGRQSLLLVTGYYHRQAMYGKEAEAWFRLGYFSEWRQENYAWIDSCFNTAIGKYGLAGLALQEIRAYKELADLHLNEGKLDQAENELLEVIERYKELNYPYLHYTYDLLSATARLKGDFYKGLRYGLSAVQNMEESGDTTDAYFIYARLGHIYRNLGLHQESINWYRRELHSWMGSQDTTYMNRYRDVCFMVQELIRLDKTQEALALVMELEAIFPPISSYDYSSVAQSLGHCYQALRQYGLAEFQYKQMMKYLAGMPDNEEVTDAKLDLGAFYVQQNKFISARPFLEDVLRTPRGIANTYKLMVAHELMEQVDSAVGDFPAALLHFRIFKQLNDSLYNGTKSRQIEELQIQYETAKKEHAIQLLQNENEIRETRLHQAQLTRNLTFGGLAMLMLTVGLLYNQYRNKQKNNRQISRQNQALQQLLKEKEWLLKEVHHRVKNNLQVVMSLLNSQTAYDNNPEVNNAMRESRFRMHAMSLIHQKLYQSTTMDRVDMNTYIRELVVFLQEGFGTRHHFDFDVQLTASLNVTQATPVGLILNEAISNALKHGFREPSGGTIQVVFRVLKPQWYRLVITDNGAGLPEDYEAHPHNSLGMDLMRGLTEQLDGIFELKRGAGLTVIIEFPEKDRNEMTELVGSQSTLTDTAHE